MVRVVAQVVVGMACGGCGVVCGRRECGELKLGTRNAGAGQE
jgi:hypothetical protein